MEEMQRQDLDISSEFGNGCPFGIYENRFPASQKRRGPGAAKGAGRPAFGLSTVPAGRRAAGSGLYLGSACSGAAKAGAGPNLPPHPLPPGIAGGVSKCSGAGQAVFPPPVEQFSGIVSAGWFPSSQAVTILRRLRREKQVEYAQLFAGKTDKSQLVATFLAVLELVKGKRIRVEDRGRVSVVVLTEDGRPIHKKKEGACDRKKSGAGSHLICRRGAGGRGQAGSGAGVGKRADPGFGRSAHGGISAAGSGLQILCLENHYQMCSAPRHGNGAPGAKLRRNVPLSQAAMEVLAVVAYNQPVTKSFVEQVRGVDCSRILGSLIVKGLLEERGRLELPGRPLLYGTTPDFLRCLGLRSLEELPPLPPLDGTERESLENQTEEHSSACQE